jgi:hypothetical protein
VEGATLSGTEIISVADPLFVGGGDYHLTACSPAINVGDNALNTAATDLDGAPRKYNNGTIDLGAYEFQGDPPASGNIRPAAGIVYVRDGGTGTKDGSSWDNAYPNLADPLKAAADGTACGTVEQIWVAAGTYYPMHIPTGGSVDRDKTFLLAKDVKVYGGFTETAPGNVYPTGTTPPAFGDPGAGREGESILSGDIGITGSVTDNAFHVVMVAGNMGDALLDGFTVSGGYGYNGSSNINGILHNRGAGIAVAGNMHFSNITVKDNEAGGNGAGAGAGIYLHSGNSTFTDITVTGNKVVQNSGGGIFINNGTHTFTDITVSNNKADDGGGIFIDNGNHTFTGVAVTGNEATATGAGIYLQGSAITSFTNILVAKNFIDDEGGAGGIQVYGNGTHTITNATIADNSNKDSGRGAGIEQSGGTLNLSNSIIWRNMRDGVPGNITGTVNHDHNLLQGGTPDGAFIVSSKDPEFVSAATGDYRLTACSPAINIGNDGLNSASTDLDGASRRYNGGIIDLGAYEYQGDPPTFSTVKPSSAGIVYVRTDGNGDGSSWDSAYPNLADPLKAAADGSACGTVQQIWVAAGTYYPMHKAGNGTQDRDKTFLLVDGVKIYGGFTKTSGNVYPTGATPPAFGADGRKGGSILSGDIGKNDGGGTKTDNAYHVVLGAGTLDNTTTVLDGFTITGGVANVSGNIMVNSVTNIMRNSGGGVYLKSNASPVLTNLVITGNTVSRLGCMYIDSSSPTLTGVKITGNEAYQGGGINTNSSSPNLTNVQITGNKTSSQGGGIYNSSSSPILVNVTIAGNSANNGGGGIYHSGSATLNIRNSIIWGNTAGNGVSGIYGTNVIHDHNLVQDATVDGVNIISAADPMFVAPESASSAPTAAGDYRLTKCSPAINAGDNTQNSTATDLDGAPRKYNNGTIDLGAYEYQGDPLTGNNLIKPDVNGIVYVIEGGDGNGDGSSWENAYPNLADPLKAAVISGTACRTVKEIWVAAGTYYPAHLPPVGYGLTDRDKTFLIVDGVKIYGGFTPVISTGKYPTGATPPAFGDDGRKGVSTLSGDIDKDGIHDADNVYHVVAASCSQGNSLLDGFTVSGGYSTGWNSGKVDVFERYCGAGIVVKGDMTFSNITVTGNMARHGGGIYVYGGNSIFTDITVSNNTTDEGSNGGGIYIAGGKPVVTNITVYDNSAGNCGGGMFLGKLDNAAVFTNILIFKNTAGNLGGGGIFLFEGTYYMTNLTVADNITRGNMGAGICLNGGALNLYLRNSVVWGNSTSGSTVNLLTNIYGSMVYYDHCLVQSISPGTSGIVSTADPEFADPAADDYRLTRCSPAINAGENSHNTYPTDLDHNPRIYDGITDQIDLGAYEYQGDPATGNVIKPDGNGIVYVIAGATGGDGSSWAKAYGNLADPLLAAANGTACRTVKEIWVAAGTYYPMHVPENPGVATTDRDKTFLLVDGVKIYGGFTKTSGNVYPTTLPAFGDEGRNGLSTLSGDFDQNDTGDPYGDALAGLKNDNVYHVVTGAGTLNGASLLDGFTLTGGYAGGSGSITVNTVSGISRNSGGGVYLKSGASPVLTNLVITGNISDSYGGGIYVESSSPALSRVKITGNGGMGHGGGMYNTDSSPVLTNVQITGNVANNFGGGMYNSNSSPVLTGVTVSGNRANSSSNTIGSGIHHAGSGTTQLLNSIVWGNTSSDGFDMYVENPANVLCSYSMVGKVRAGNNFTFAGILSSNIPQFESYVPATATVPVSGGDYRLKLTSPLIDIGNDTYVSGISTDLAGNARIQGCGVDLGAYETPPANIVPSSGRVYIRTNGVGDGSSWTDAYSNLSVALSRAKCIGITEIWVAAGTYVPETPILHTGDKAFTNDNTFLLVNGVKIYGGFNATAPESALDHRDTITVNGIITEMVNKTVLSGDLNGDDDQPGGDQSDNAFHVVTGFMTLDPATTVLDGFTVTGGVADAYLLGTGSAKLNFPGTNNYYGLERGAGGGIYLAHGASLRLNNLVITGNTADAERNHNGQGGGIYNHLSSPVINSVQITDNAAELGGGMYNSNNSSPVMTRTEISGNTAARDGGGIFNYASGSSSTLTNGFITGNTASRGGGVMNEGGSSTLTNVLIVGNSATGTDLNFQNGDGGGGIRNNGGSSTLINVTLTGNEATVKGGGICGSGVTLRNTIIWGNTAPANPDMTNDPSVCSYSLLPPAFSSVPGVISTSDPLFVSAGSDYRLQPASPGVNTGYNGHNHTDTDLDGNPRIFGGIIDLGAFETQEEPVLITAVNDTALTTVNTPVLIGVLDNDDLGTCGANPDFDIVAGPAHGIATFDTDTLIYTPNTGHYGIDSLDYEFGCDGKTVQARVYILTLKPLSNEYRACPNASVTMGFAEIPDVQYDWFESDGTTPSTPSSGATITRTKDNTGNPEVWYARAVWKGITFPLYRVTLNPAADVKPAVADIRLTLCPQLPRTVYLTALLDSLPYASAVQWTAVGASPVPADAATGELNTAAFPDLGTFTYTYNRISECATSSATAKAYVHIAHGKIPPRHDTVAICREQASAINISAIFGFELNGAPASTNASAYTATTSLNAVIFDGDKAYADNAGTAVVYRGTPAQAFDFTYAVSSPCSPTGTRKIVIVITE